MDNTVLKEATDLSKIPPQNTPLSNLRHEAFCNEYLKSFNITQSYIDAGYSEGGARQAGSLLLSHIDIQARLAELTRERFSRMRLDADYVLKKAHHIVERCLQEVEPVVAHGLHVKDKKTGRPLYTFQAQTAVKALEIMGKHVAVGAFTPDINIEHGQINVLVGGKRCTCGGCTCQGRGVAVKAGESAPQQAITAQGGSQES
ncbi:MAG: terminase small subunit [Planctomycetes bacterium]|nr:terminase small subunit [Planctomycetota bacterium]